MRLYIPPLVNGGVYVLEPQALAEIQPGQAASIERDVFPRLASRRQLAGHEQSAYFADIGTPESLAAFERDVLDGLFCDEGSQLGKSAGEYPLIYPISDNCGFCVVMR